jgi:ATP-binding cassette subfamily B protein
LIAIQKQQNIVSHKINALLFDYLSNIKTLITLRFQKRAQYELESVMSQLIPLEVSYARYNEWKRWLMDTIIWTVVVCMMMLYIFWQYQKKGLLAIWDLTIIFWYMQKLRHAFDNITRYYGELIKQGTDLHAVDDLIQEYSKEHQNSLENIHSKQHRSKLTISNLNFSYKSSEHTSQTLQNISLQIISGQKIAFVWASGSGKSTMLALLRGLYSVDNVSLRLDEIHYDSLHSITEHTSLIPQDPEIFENTMRYNITCGLEVSDESILQYCRMARFDEVLDQLPNGLNTDIKEKGVNLSGGQKQRLALARGLLLSSDSDILLLDEPTSSVDATNEKIIFTNILQFFDKRTIIAVMHRLHLLNMFDYIYVFDQGRIIEEWSFQQLKQRKWKLYSMRQEYSLQEHT